MSNSLAYKHLLRALSRWPSDLLRPDIQFQDAMRRRIDQRFIPPKDAGKTNQDAAINPMVSEKYELEQANVLYSFLENRYANKYPITGQLMKPKSAPDHYEALLKELQEAPHRNWLQRFWMKWNTLIRWR